jgi:anti-anti-sigma regulatory factor
VSPDAVVFVLSGEMDREHVARLQEMLVSEGDDHVVLDLQDITLVNREAVRFLASVEAAGISVANCPEYVRTWIAAERDGQ